MAKPRAILKRRRAVQNISRITKTMQMIATAKFKRAFDRAVAARPYTDRLATLIGELATTVEGFSHPLLERRPARRIVALAVASNRGLCGGYNSAVARTLVRFHREAVARGVEVEVQASAKKLVSMLRYQRVKTEPLRGRSKADVTISGGNLPAAKTVSGVEMTTQHLRQEDTPTFAAVNAMADSLLARYESREIDEVWVVYTKFLSSARQRPVAEQVLPLVLPEATREDAPKGSRPDWIFSPDAASILAELLPRSVRVRVYQAFLDAAVSEQTARMIAMKAATDNAVEMIRSLTRLYNRSRQTQITTELSEIMGGAAALE